MDENDVEEASDQDVEDSGEHIFEDDVEGDEQDVEDDEDDDEVVSGNASSIRALTSKFRSEAWKEYVPVIANGKVSSGRCKHCDKMISAKRGAGTSVLLKHLDRCKKRYSALRIMHGLSSTLRSPDGHRLKNWTFDPVTQERSLPG